ncbi:MAG: prepilin-type N-terminal cleavage/methylation domain-containing protein [Opitutales bacterium]
MHRRSAFTLVEILLSLALLALVATLFISGATNFLRLREARPDEDFWRAVTAARQQALDTEQIVALKFDPDTHQLGWSWPDGHAAVALPGATLRFLAADKGATKLLGGIVTETDALPSVHFYPDGTCDAFRAELTGPDGRPDLLQVDPWTCAPVLPPAP